MRKSLPIIAALALFTLALTAKAAIFVAVDGIKGDSTLKGHAGAITALRFNLEVTAPHDVATGQASGKVVHGPLIITKEIDAATPQLFQALTTNEHIKSVTLEIMKPTGDGKEAIIYIIKLSNVSVSHVKQYTEEHTNNNIEDVSFSYEKIEVESPAHAATGDTGSTPHLEPPVIKIPALRPPNK